jgi:N-methylhydantoinase B
MPYVVKAAIEYYPANELKPGDGILVNDSFIGSGHFPDFYLVTPVFVAGDLIGFVANIAHHVDVGGAAPGSQKVLGVTESFQEGIRIMPVRILNEGEYNEELLRIILANVRMPTYIRGDLSAQRNANYVGAQRLEGIFARYGTAVVEQYLNEIFDRSEARIRELIAAIPEGTYSFEDSLDGWEDDNSIKVAVDVTISGGEATLDFSRSSDQVPAAINSYINYTRAHSLFAIRAFTDPLMPQNEGAVRPIKVVGRKGSFFNPTYPAPSGGRSSIQIRIFEVINGALAKALPERAMGGFSHWSNPIIGGIDQRSGNPFIFYDLIFGGYGARSYADGVQALAPVINCANVPIEVHETYNPVVIRRLELIPDTGGAGKFQGGCGVRKDIELRTERAEMTLLGDRHQSVPYGLFGGGSGAVAVTLLERDGRQFELKSKETRTIQKGDVISLRLSGAGGYGLAAERDPELVRDDIAQGYVSTARAERDYGVKAVKS